ncbi:RusA family crossover junction endodeoxyribonuclease [Chryseobacterium sp.]|uniref:RusA family crossover junction endodeoxyribonuclease n=1 Tax=Chryseobacterium sp. TaxID=1871047 RepID=UPI002FC7C1DB
MNVKIVNKNCNFESPYLIEEFADSSIEIDFNFKRIITAQSKKQTQDILIQDIRNELRNFKWLILGKVQVEIHWFIDAVERQETDKIGDLDNITKPLLDSLTGYSGVLIDDSQINFFHSTWTSKNGTIEGNIVKIIINFNNDYSIMKENLCFIQTGLAVYMPLNIDLDNENQLQTMKFFIGIMKAKRILSDSFKKNANANLERLLIYSEYEFHRTRLVGFDKKRILTSTAFEEICNKKNIDISSILNTLKNINL